MNSVRKKHNNIASNSSDNGFLVINNSNDNSMSSKNGSSDSMSSLTPNKSRAAPLKSMYQTPKVKSSGGAIKPQYINTQEVNSSIKQQKAAMNIAVPSPFDYQYGSYLIPFNLMTPYTANVHKTSNSSYFTEAESSFNNNSMLADENDTFENVKEAKKRSISSANNNVFFAPVRPTISMRTSSSSSSMFTNVSKPLFSNDLTKDDMLLTSSPSRHSVQIDSIHSNIEPFDHVNENSNLYVTKITGMDNTFKLKINYSYTFSSTNPLNSIIFSNLNDNLTMSYFLSNIKILEPCGKVAVKEALNFKIIKDGRKDINTFLLNFYSLEALQYFNECFVADLVKYKKMFNSKHLILRKCHLDSNVLSNVKNDILNLEVGNKQLAVHLFGSFAYEADDVKLNLYNVKKLHVKNQEEQFIEDGIYEPENQFEDISVSEAKTLADGDRLNHDSSADSKEQYIKVLKYDGHLQVSAFSENMYNKEDINSKYKTVKFLQNTVYQKIVFKKNPPTLPEVDHLTFSNQNKSDMNSTLNDADGQGILDKDQSCDKINDNNISPTNRSSRSSLPLSYEANTFDDVSRVTSVSGFMPFGEDSPKVRKINYTNRLIFISNLPPVVKIFDLVNVIRGGLIEQIRFVQGQKFCFVKFVLPSSANLFYDCCKLRPVILHGFQLNVDFGKKGVELAPVSPSLLMKISAGATRNVYLSLPEFAYKKIYTKDKRYNKFKRFRLPSPEDIIADFGTYFGPLEQINFAKDNHCCWINFMSIHSAIKLMKALKKNSPEFHETFQNKYLGLVFKFGKDRCEKLPKDVYQ
ncbi:hypothetical protein FOG48_02909 [Hanseniaspora uvarum]|nr:hypothetical protein FOG48_02909 [Hanseniaspora uvarum]